MRKKKSIPNSMIALAITTGVGFFAYSMMSSSSAPAVIREEKMEAHDAGRKTA